MRKVLLALVVAVVMSGVSVYADCAADYNNALNAAASHRQQCYQNMGLGSWWLYIAGWEDDQCQVQYQTEVDIAATVVVDCYRGTGQCPPAPAWCNASVTLGKKLPEFYRVL